MPYFRRIAQHYETTGALDEAERYYIRADMARDAVEMYSRAGKWEAAQRVARGYLTENEMRQFYRAKAAEFEQAGKFREAEKAYVAAGGDEVDKAIAMYKRAKMYDQMIRLVTNYRKEKVAEVGVAGGVVPVFVRNYEAFTGMRGRRGTESWGRPSLRGFTTLGQF